MVKSALAVAVVAGVVLFGYFYATNRAGLSRAEKARQAAVAVGDAVRDKGIAGLVQGRLLAKFGLEATRFVHAYYNEGRVVLYGLAPADLPTQALADEAARVPGVDAVELLVQPRPDYIAPLKPRAPTTAEQPQPEPTPGTPSP